MLAQALSTISVADLKYNHEDDQWNGRKRLASMGYFLHHRNLDIWKIIRLKRLHLKILQTK